MHCIDGHPVHKTKLSNGVLILKLELFRTMSISFRLRRCRSLPACFIFQSKPLWSYIPSQIHLLFYAFCGWFALQSNVKIVLNLYYEFIFDNNAAARKQSIIGAVERNDLKKALLCNVQVVQFSRHKPQNPAKLSVQVSKRRCRSEITGGSWH